MPITKQKKEEILKGLQEKLKGAKIIIFVNFHGLNVSRASELRVILRNIGSEYTVAKKTLIKKALSQFGFEGEIPSLDGEAAMAFSESDPIGPARELNSFAKKNNIKILGGVFENKFIGSETVVMLANIPPREILLGQFANVINSPIQGVVGVLQGILRNFVGVLSEAQKKRS